MEPLISIITISYNSESTIEQTIKSVITQSYPKIEYIIIDGGSKDNTLDKVKSFKSQISKFISESDKGIYDAMNKGLKLATGDIIGFLNADDFLYDERVIEDIAKEFERTNAEVIYGNKIYVDPVFTQKVTRVWNPGVYNRLNFKRGWMPPHLSTYIKKSMYEKFGYFNLSFKIAADYELLFRFMYINKAKSFYLDRNIVFMRAGGVSNSTLKNYWISNYEVFKSWKINNQKISPLIIIEKPFRKIKQFFK